MAAKKALAGQVPRFMQNLVRPERFELPTSWFVARRSIQLSYGRARAANITTSMSERHSAGNLCIVVAVGLGGLP